MLPTGAIYASLSGCDLSQPSSWTLTAHDNRIYSTGAGTVECGAELTLAQYAQHTGQEQRSALLPVPSTAQMMAWGRAQLWPVGTALLSHTPHGDKPPRAGHAWEDF